MLLIGNPTTMGLLLGGFVLSLILFAGIIIFIGKNIQSKQLSGGFDVPAVQARKEKQKRPKKVKDAKPAKTKKEKVKKSKAKLEGNFADESSPKPRLLDEGNAKENKFGFKKDSKPKLLQEDDEIGFIPVTPIIPSQNISDALPSGINNQLNKVKPKSQGVLDDSGFDIVPPKQVTSEDQGSFGSKTIGEDW